MFQRSHPSLLLPWSPCQEVSVLFNDKSRPRSGLPGEGGGWVWQLEPLSLHGAAAAPPPLGTQMGFIQQTKPPPPHPGHTGTWTQASPWEGGGDRRIKRSLQTSSLASLLFFIFHKLGFSPGLPTLHLHPGSPTPILELWTLHSEAAPLLPGTGSRASRPLPQATQRSCSSENEGLDWTPKPSFHAPGLL